MKTDLVEEVTNKIIESIERLTKDAVGRGCNDGNGVNFRLDHYCFSNDSVQHNFFALNCSRTGQENFNVPRNEDLVNAIWAKVEEKVREKKWGLEKTQSIFALTFFIAVL